ncbi:hypothetical protein AAZX31_04G057800 [Glycine max]|uniref:Uncharacterized protein n=2 Tax=Glycine subgen. Soja TaxID=1462606 RepID=K7KIC5_SOYBN|nr:hypothetical protein JHK85_009446 [Glycine max]KHN29647.1 hypothetical protein glysoja_016269 [Glycine soja]KAG5065458.1 hypothetical protein JHK86_009189 [Glycine max]KAH1109992.1 hypothetical protein GYH30_009075 [Glycine max]KAH1252724.1 hypothetical protein GmHk_04G009613 [Glycine max]
MTVGHQYHIISQPSFFPLTSTLSLPPATHSCVAKLLTLPSSPIPLSHRITTLDVIVNPRLNSDTASATPPRTSSPLLSSSHWPLSHHLFLHYLPLSNKSLRMSTAPPFVSASSSPASAPLLDATSHARAHQFHADLDQNPRLRIHIYVVVVLLVIIIPFALLI